MELMHGLGENSLAHASTSVLLGLGFYPKSQSPLLHLMHNFSLAHVFNKINTTSPLNKKPDLVKLNQFDEGPNEKNKNKPK